MKSTSKKNPEPQPDTDEQVKTIAQQPDNINEPESEAVNNGLLFTNQLCFELPQNKIPFWVSDKEVSGYRRFHFRKLPKEIHRLVKGLHHDRPFVWMTTEPQEDLPSIKIKLKKHPAVANYWITREIRNHLSPLVRLTRKNFAQNWEYWQEVSTLNTKHYIAFRKFTIQVNTEMNESRADLLITYDGISYALKYALSELTEKFPLNTHEVHKVVFEKQVRDYNHLPDSAGRQPEKLYPILNREIASAMNMEFPTSPEKLKLTMSYRYIKEFYRKYIGDEAFRQVIPHRQVWNTINENNVFVLQNRSRELQFGGKVLTPQIYHGLANNGPAAISPKPHIKVFMIYHQLDAGKAGLLKDFIIGRKGFVKLTQVTRRVMTYVDELDLVLNDASELEEQAVAHLQKLTLEASTDYFVFYLSPYSKTTPNAEHRQLYYRIKELLLHRDIMSQTIDKQKFHERDFGLSIINIGMAMVAKLGGIPWRLATQPEEELIIGFGAHRVKQKAGVYVGSAFCFDNLGIFQEFDCWQADAVWALNGTLAKAIKKYREQHPRVERVVIHYYKELGRKDFKMIDKLIDDLDADIPVIVVRINTTFDQGELILNPGSSIQLPLNGSYVRLKYHQYLLHINENEDDNQVCNKAPLPLKVSFQSNRVGLVDDPELIERLMRQIYSFSLLHWRTVKQPRLPVTVAYPKMMAEVFPWFSSDVLPEAGRKRLWFL